MVSVPVWAVVLCILLVVLAFVGLIASATATRLNRMHIRTDLARSALEAALGRRAAIARATYPELAEMTTKAEALRLTADDPFARVDAENQLTAQLTQLVEKQCPEPALAIELHDAYTRVELARRFYNDAVTDTRALRRQPFVKYLRLAGTAPVPEYVDMFVASQSD
ncbi:MULTISPECIES: NUDIX hydrolase [unclassified Corynebacterium]|uniref:NUDIX hydrolase n=1 Tax=unclassified Corynebacterium TaxID=2624378 RepID=UPI0030B061A7